MIRNSFIILEKISHKTEKNIWQQGINDWDDFIETKRIKGISPKRKAYYDRKLTEAKHALYSSEIGYFKSLLPQSETWRLYDFFRDNSIFLDIEASGVRKDDDITMIGLFDGINTKTMIRGINLDINGLADELKKHSLIVTYNGSTFDIPFLDKRYPKLLPEITNLDLRCCCQRLGLNGGLKEIEKSFGIERNRIIENLSNGDPYTLWRMFRATGDEYYLNLLVEYNEEDIVNLKKIADYCCSRLKGMMLDECA